MPDIKLSVNGSKHTVTVENRALLADVLRDQLGLTGTHIGCDTSQCGCCTVLLDDKAIKSCTLLAVQAEDRHITTVEGLASEAALHPVQEAFSQCHGLQCGFCTPGMLMSACALLERNPTPTREEIQLGISGNLCRCTGYARIIDAIERSI